MPRKEAHIFLPFPVISCHYSIRNKFNESGGVCSLITNTSRKYCRYLHTPSQRMSQVDFPQRVRERPPSLLACITCRNKHLRCDAQMPVCGRCKYRKLSCVYVESKRGYVPRKEKENRIVSTDPESKTLVSAPTTDSAEDVSRDIYLSKCHRFLEIIEAKTL